MILIQYYTIIHLFNHTSFASQAFQSYCSIKLMVNTGING